MRFSLPLLGACCLALLGCAAATGSSNNLWGLVGKWQGVCVTKGYDSHCAPDIISYPFYVEYSLDPYSYKCNVQYRQDAVTIDTWSSHSDSRHYAQDSYYDKGSCYVQQSYDGFCVDAEYENYSKRTYRVKLKHEGELDVLIEEGAYSQTDEHTGIWHQCPTKSWRSLQCDSYTYTYRCYLVRASSWTWSW